MKKIALVGTLVVSFLAVMLYREYRSSRNDDIMPMMGEEEKSPDAAEIEKIKEEVKKELGEEFSIEVIEGWFVTAGNAKGNNSAKRVIRGVYNAMYKDFLSKKIDYPIKVYLFKDKESYEAYHVKTYGKKPSTPFGFYNSGDRKMVMNIGTGTGTLVHELIHPLLDHDFPGVPAWFNEGFASLFEACTFADDGSIKGLVNWRLPGLQKAIRDGGLVPLRTLISTTTDEFYGEKMGIHYAEARYLCLYLQEKGLLKEFYTSFRDGYKEEKTGARALEKVTGKRVEDLEQEWIEWAKPLRYQ